MVTSPCSSPVFRSSSPHIATATNPFSPVPSKIRLHRPNAAILSTCSSASAASPTSDRKRSHHFSPPKFDPPSPRSPVAASSSLYQVLGLSIGASNHEIKSAYRKLARICHPDVAGDGRNNDFSKADEFMRINDAYSTLLDPIKRADHDRKLTCGISRSRPLSSYTIDELMASASSSSYKIPRRNWETDQCW